MREDGSLFPQSIYSEHLAIINGVHFTRREIDVIACLLSMRGASRIASLLSIAHRTVIAHTRNIMLKLECNSREGIIDFIEKSGQLFFLRKHYASILIQEEFEKTLKEIVKLRRKEKASSLLLLWQDPEQKSAFVQHLENHLKKAGLDVGIKEVNGQLYNENREISNSSLLLLEKFNHQKISQNLVGLDEIDIEDYQNYYFLVIDILKKLFPELSLDKILTDFKDKYEAIRDDNTSKNSKSSLEEKNREKASNYGIWDVLRKSQRKLAFIILTISLSVMFFIFQGEQKNSNTYSDLSNPISKNKEPLIQSDLSLPTKLTFLHRPELIKKINEKFKRQDGIQTVALVGLGGAGKTTLAREYVHQQKAKVIWEINAETHESLKSSFENLAEALSQTEEDKKMLRGIREMKSLREKEEKIIQFVKERLRTHSNWFLIYDNIEKFTDIHPYFPQDSITWGDGKILLTTRNANIQNNKHVSYSLQVDELTPVQKLNLFTKILRGGDPDSSTSIQKEEAEEFLEKIPSFPLDVSVAAYYIKATNISYKKYLEILNQHGNIFENIQEDLLQESGGYKNTRFKIITLSINQLININQNFEELLFLINILDSQNIPRDLLVNYKNEAIVSDFIYHLKNYSLIVNRPNFSSQSIPTLSLHRSIQAISLAYLKKSLDSEKIRNNIQSIVNTLQIYISDLLKNSDIEKIKYLISHCETLLKHHTLLPQAKKGVVQGSLGCIYYCLCNYEKAQQLLENGLVNLNSNRNNSYGLKAQLLAYLGTTNKNLGNFERAKSLLEKSIFIYKSRIPEDYDGFAWALSKLGDIYRSLGDVEKAKDLLEQSINIYNVKNSGDYTGRAQALVYLGVVYRDLGNYVQSKLMYEQSFKLYQKYLPSDYIRIGRVLAHSGNIHRELGNYYRSKELILQSLNIYQQRFPTDHIDIGWVLVYLGNTYRELKEYEEALKLIQKSLTIYKKCYPEDHVETAWVMWHLGNVYTSLAQYQKAKELIAKSLAVYKIHYGEMHIETAKILRDLGHINLLEEHMNIAEDLLQRSLEILQKNKHPESYKSLENLAELVIKKSLQTTRDIQQAQSFKEQAKNYLIQAQKIIKSNFPPDSPHLTRINAKLKELEN